MLARFSPPHSAPLLRRWRGPVRRRPARRVHCPPRRPLRAPLIFSPLGVTYSRAHAGPGGLPYPPPRVRFVLSRQCPRPVGHWTDRCPEKLPLRTLMTKWRAAASSVCARRAVHQRRLPQALRPAGLCTKAEGAKRKAAAPLDSLSMVHELRAGGLPPPTAEVLARLLLRSLAEQESRSKARRSCRLSQQVGRSA